MFLQLLRLFGTPYRPIMKQKKLWLEINYSEVVQKVSGWSSSNKKWLSALMG